MLMDEDLLFKHRRMRSERAESNKREEQGRYDNHSCQYRHKNRLPFALSLAMWSDPLPVLLPGLEAEDLTQTTRKGGRLPTGRAGGRREGFFWRPMEICAEDDERDGDRTVACLRNGTLNRVHVDFK